MLITDRERLRLLRAARDREAFVFVLATIGAVSYGAGVNIVTGPVLVAMVGYWLAQLLGTLRMIRAVKQGTAPDLRTRGDHDAW